MSLLPLAEAQARLLALGEPLPAERVPLLEAAGRWLAEPVAALRSQPAADLSAMDGYAIRFADLPGPWTIVGESAAGRGLDRKIATGEAARIFTGAPIPPGADTILIQEEAERIGDGPRGDRLRLAGEGPRARGTSVRPHGADFRSGSIVAAAGDRMTPPRIAIVATGGHGIVAVPRRPRVALISTGDELVPAGAATPGVHLPASNAPMLAAMLAATPAIVRDDGIVPDRLDRIADAFRTAAAWADIIVTTGGASVGDHDLIRPALAQAGATLDFWKVAMRPGKPLLAGRLGRAIVLGLPGNPVAAFVTGHLFLVPLVGRLSGDRAPLPHFARASLGAALPANGARTNFLRGRRDGADVVAFPSRDSAILTELAEADVLIVRPPHAPEARKGDTTEIVLLT